MFFSPPKTGLFSYIPPLSSITDFIKLTKISQPTYQTYTHNLTHLDQWLIEGSYSRELPLGVAPIQQWFKHLTEQQHLSSSTIKQRLAAVCWLHKVAGIPPTENPTYDLSFRGIGKQTKQIRRGIHLGNEVSKAAPLRLDDIRKIVRCCPDSAIGRRDKALVLTGFGGALRRSELVGLRVRDLTFNPDKSLTITIPSSKTDQLAEGQTVVIHPARNPKFCPLASLKEWLDSAGIESGFVFPAFTRGGLCLSPRTVNLIIKRCCQRAGYNPDLYSGHSLRRGVLITAAEKGASINDLRVHARHRHSTTTEDYIGQSAFSSRNPTRTIW